jgi:hypothetical protein
MGIRGGRSHQAENSSMLDFIGRLGFTCHRMADDLEVMEARLQL